MSDDKRVIKSFEPEDDVARMLERAEKRGVKLTWLVNASLRKFLTAEGYGKRKEPVK